MFKEQVDDNGDRYTKTTLSNGRLCNQVIRNMAVHFIAEKHNLFVEYSPNEFLDTIGIKLHCGEKKCDKTLRLTDENYIEILNMKDLDCNLNPNDNYFQTLEVTNMIYNFFHENAITIRANNKDKDRYNNNNDVLLHIRLTDAQQHTVGLEYFLYVLSIINYDNIYITTDDFNHYIIKEILLKYPQANVLCLNEIKTIMFASTCKHIILSHGTFSAIIGYLAFDSDVYYLHSNPGWCPLSLFEEKNFYPIEKIINDDHNGIQKELYHLKQKK
jgi:hypothetical protein